MGIVAWDLMHVNRSGFNLLRGSGGISGCVDPHTFYNPVWSVEGKDDEQGLEETLESFSAKQYLEVTSTVIIYRGCQRVDPQAVSTSVTTPPLRTYPGKCIPP